MKETDLEYAKYIALVLLQLEVEETEFEPILVHPFITNRFMCINNDISKMINVMESDENIAKAKEYYANAINKSDSIWHLYILIHKPYRALYFKLIYEHLSKEDYNEFLKSVWIDSENPNQDPNVSIVEWIRFYKKADKKILMNDADYKIYEALPENEPITIYRGIGSGREPFGLSWTQNYKTAEWFAKRWNNSNPYILKAQCTKKDVLAYLNERNEDELVVNIKDIHNIERINI